ncbi:pentapeptide repeat-containing protein, partial [Bifidobacterium bifidum]
MKITTPHGTLEGESIEAILAKYGFDCLRGANLRGFDLPRADLTRANL